MRNRSLSIAPAAAVALLVAALVVPSFLSGRLTEPPPGQAVDGARGVALRITLGIGDAEARDWDGNLALSAGRVARLQGWQFALTDAIEGSSWKAASKKAPVSRAQNPATPPQVEPLGILPVGVEAVVEARPETRVTVTTKHGSFHFDLGSVAFGRPRAFLEGSARVERIPVAERLSSAENEDDHPAMAVTRDGTVWVAWIAYRGGADRILARSFSAGRWSEPLELSTKSGDYFRVCLVERGPGDLCAVWSSQEGGDWELHARFLERGKWTPVTRLTHNTGPDIFPALASGKDGRLALAWMSFRAGQPDVYVMTLDGSAWSPEVKVSESEASDWEPAVAIDSKGTAWVAWDSYERGSYNVLLRAVAAGKPEPVVRVTDSARYHARASVTVDPRDRVWIAWEDSEANWGKDYGYIPPTPWKGAGNGLYRSRAVQVAVLEGGALKTPARPLADAIPAALRTYVQLPQLAADPAGRIWAVVRVRTFVRTETTDVWASGGRWNPHVVVYAGGEWLEAVPFGDSVGPNYARAGLALAPDGKVWTAWQTDQRLFANPPRQLPAASNLQPNALQGFGAVPGNYEVLAASLDPSDFAFRPSAAPHAELVGLRPELASAAPVHPEEEANVRRIRGYEIVSGGKRYRIHRGDMHRHTDISADGAGDGSVYDLFRYALDAARMDYAMVTDHNSGFDQEYSWWRIEKVIDLFHVPGAMTTLFGYERSLGYPNGHRNVAFATRGIRTLPIAPGEQPAGGEVKVASGSVLYPYLRRNRGIAFSHTSHTGMGTDWRDNDPEVEPLVEIYQGMRTSAELEGAPLTPNPDRPETHQGGYRPLGYVSNAWAKGWRLGVQASSDHVSTHISYSCVISEDRSREGLMNAMRRRHAYAATDNIILDVRMQDGSAEYIQGDEFEARAAPRLVVRVIGTRPVADVEVIKNSRAAYSRKPGVREAEFTYSDADTQPGTSYYYVRVVQEDGQVAWSSPIWVTFRPK